MAVPRNRSSNARKNARRSHHAKQPRHLGVCATCGAARPGHRVCLGCGSYRARAVFRTEQE